MLVILNDKNEFYSRTSNGGVEFTSNFAKATIFHTWEIAMIEWNENGTDEISVHIEDI